MKYERIIITNNPSVNRSYAKADKVVYMEGATPYEVYSAVKEMLEKGGRLTRPVLKDKTDYFTTACVFFDGSGETTPWNMREIEAACRATRGMAVNEAQSRSRIAQFMDKWHNAPAHRAA